MKAKEGESGGSSGLCTSHSSVFKLCHWYCSPITMHSQLNGVGRSQFPSCVLGKELRVVESDPKDALFLSTVLGTGCIPEVPNYTGTPRKQPL